jgi:hypothetical protein
VEGYFADLARRLLSLCIDDGHNLDLDHGRSVPSGRQGSQTFLSLRCFLDDALGFGSTKFSTYLVI